MKAKHIPLLPEPDRIKTEALTLALRDQGELAHRAGKPKTANPFRFGYASHVWWNIGWERSEQVRQKLMGGY